MLKRLLILGAGASKELKLPSGNDLKTKISSALRLEFADDHGRAVKVANKTIHDAMVYLTDKDRGQNWQKYVEAAGHISEAIPMARSIDEFLNSHNTSKETELCGKLAIVQEILESEKVSLVKTIINEVSNEETINFRQLGDTWYNRFASLVFSCPLSELQERLDLLTVIIFNYDRCFEHYMFHGIKTYYKLPDAEAAKLVSSMKIYHPYGVVGALRWMNRGPASCKFGEVAEGRKLLELAGGIKTFTEGIDPGSSEIVAIKEAVKYAETVVFLGFGFISLNMELLYPGKFEPGKNSRKVYYATGKGLSDRDTRLVENELMNFSPANYTEVNISNKLVCADIFTEYARSLALG